MLSKTPCTTTSNAHSRVITATSSTTLANITVVMVIIKIRMTSTVCVGPSSALCDEKHPIKWVPLSNHVATLGVDHGLKVLTDDFQ